MDHGRSYYDVLKQSTQHRKKNRKRNKHKNTAHTQAHTVESPDINISDYDEALPDHIEATDLAPTTDSSPQSTINAVTQQGDLAMPKGKKRYEVDEFDDSLLASSDDEQTADAAAASTPASPATAEKALSPADALKHAWKELNTYFNDKVARTPNDHSLLGQYTWKATSSANTIDGWDADYAKNMQILIEIAEAMDDMTADSADSRKNLGKALTKAQSKLGYGANTFRSKLEQMIAAFEQANKSAEADQAFGALKTFVAFTETPSSQDEKASRNYIKKDGYKSPLEKAIDADIAAIAEPGKRMDAEMANALRYLYLLNQQEELDTHHLLFGQHLMSRTLIHLRGLVGEPNSRDAFVHGIKDDIQGILEGYKTEKAQHLRGVPAKFTEATAALTQDVKEKITLPFKRELANMFLKETNDFANKAPVKQKLGTICDLTCRDLGISNKPAEKKMAAKA